MERIKGIGWIALICALIFSISVQIYDRFTGNGTAWTFYAPDIDMTCIVGKDAGQKAMYCVQGKQEADNGQ